MENRLIKGDTAEYVREPMMVIDSIDVLSTLTDNSFYLRKNIFFKSTTTKDLLKEIDQFKLRKIGNIKKENPSIILNFDVPENLPNVSTEVLKSINTCFKDLMNPNILWTISKVMGSNTFFRY